MHTKALVIAASIVAMFPGAALAATLREPDSIAVSPERHPLQLLGAAMEAVQSSKEEWRLDGGFGVSETTGGYRIRVIKEWNGRHVIYAYVTATPKAISITYADSRELDFKVAKDGVRKIHSSYNDFTELLAGEIESRLPQMCADLSALGDKQAEAVSYASLSQQIPALRVPGQVESIPATGYVVREYAGFIPNGMAYDCGKVSAVFLDDRLHGVHAGSAALAKLSIQGEIISQKYRDGKIPYGQAAYEFKEAELDYTDALESYRQKQLLSYYRLLASRLSKKEISVEEFDYLAIEKEAELKGQQDAIEHKQSVDRELVAAEREKAMAMRGQAVAAQSQAQAAHQANFQNFLNSLKTVTCSSYGYGNTATTTCR